MGPAQYCPGDLSVDSWVSSTPPPGVWPAEPQGGRGIVAWWTRAFRVPPGPLSSGQCWVQRAMCVCVYICMCACARICPMYAVSETCLPPTRSKGSDRPLLLPTQVVGPRGPFCLACLLLPLPEGPRRQPETAGEGWAVDQGRLPLCPVGKWWVHSWMQRWKALSHRPERAGHLSQVPSKSAAVRTWGF